MSLQSSLSVFMERPRRTAVLAFLLAVVGLVSASGVVPLGENRHYFPGHEWLLAALSWICAIVLGCCAVVGARRKADE